MRGIIGGRDAGDDNGKRNVRRFLPLVLFIVICLVLGIWSGVNMTRGGGRETATGQVRTTGRSGRKDSDGEAITSARPEWRRTAERVMRASLGWSRKDGRNHHASVADLIKAGMDRQAAETYVPLWDSVFAPSASADLDPSSASMRTAFGAVGDGTLDYAVTLTLSPRWTDRKGRTAHVRQGESLWMVTIDRKTGHAVALRNPDPKWLWFALPADGLVPGPDTDAKDGGE